MSMPFLSYFFKYGVDLVHLPVDLVGRHFVPGTDQHELILIALKQAGQRLGQNFLRNSRADQAD